MKIEITKQAVRGQRVDYMLVYDLHDSPGSGFAFDCDADGNLLKHTPEAALNYIKAQDTGKYRFMGIQRYEANWTEPATGACPCGQDVDIFPGEMTSSCDNCGRDYDWNGVLLVNRSLWGEETGEHPADINRQM